MRTSILSAIAVALIATCPRLDAQSCKLACDINTRVGAVNSSGPGTMARCGSSWYFAAASTPEDGAELWKTDGTAAGTVMVKNFPGRRGFSVSWLTCCNGKVYFRAGTSQHGFEPWVSDGTPGGTFMLKDIRPGSLNSVPNDPVFACIGTKVVFAADDGQRLGDLWVTDGTSAGTRRLGVASRISQVLANSAGTEAYFTAAAGLRGFELFKTDGTAAGSGLLKDIWPGSGSGAPRRFVNFKGRTFFSARDGTHGIELWVTDGTPAGTRMVKDIRPGSQGSDPSLIAGQRGVLGNKLYFAANDGSSGVELWETDGTAAGTKLAGDIVSGSTSSFPEIVLADSGALYFTAQDLTARRIGRELFRLASGSVQLVKDVNPGSASSHPGGFLGLGNGKVLFSANDGTHGWESWITDGTPAGTKLVRDLNPGSPDGGRGARGRIATGRVLIAGNDGKTGWELWESDGTATGTKLFKDLAPGSVGLSSSPREITAAWGSTVYMSADDGVNGREPWVHDASGRCRMLKDIVPGSNGSFPASFTPFWTGSRALVLFTAFDSAHGTELWVTDGTAAGTRLVKDIRPGQTGSGIANMLACNGKVFFTANQGFDGAEPWVSDGTAGGTRRLADLNPGSTGSFIARFICVSGMVYFTASDGNTAGLYKTDGTPAGTVRVTSIAGGAGGRGGFARLGDRIVFSGGATRGDDEPWISDGTKAGTKRIKDIRAGASGSIPRGFTTCNGKVFFRANDGTHGTELWVTDGTATGTTMVKDIRPGTFGSSPVTLSCCAGRLLFFVPTGISQGDLWTSDGTAGGTHFVKSFQQRPFSPTDLVCLGDELFFVSDDGGGAAIWRSDGTAAGTTRVCGPQSPSSPSRLTPAGGVLYFSGSTRATGTELFQVTEPAAMVETLGQGCPPAYPTLTASAPTLGGTLVLTSSRGPAGHVGFLTGGALIARPVLAPFSSPCALWLDLGSAVPIGGPSTAPGFRRSLPVPNLPSLKGGSLVFQTLWLNATTLFPVKTSNGVRTTIGI